MTSHQVKASAPTLEIISSGDGNPGMNSGDDNVARQQAINKGHCVSRPQKW
jgi:hypothetical protein